MQLTDPSLQTCFHDLLWILTLLTCHCFSTCVN